MTAMQLISIQVGGIKTHDLADGSTWTTAYQKEPVSGPVQVTRLRVEGDDQKHKKVHGGVHRAVLCYAAAHYDYWRKTLNRDLPCGAFGENFTVSGLDEESVAIGDVFQVGTVKLQVSQPRQPCNQIATFWQIAGLDRQVKATGFTGWYLRVLEEGSAEAGMSLQRLESPHPEWTIRRVHTVRDQPESHRQDAADLAVLEPLNPEWREYFVRIAAG